MKAFAQNKTQKGTPHALVQKQGDDSFFGIQAKLSIGKPNDKYEKEADSVADKVVAKSTNQSNFFGGGSFFPNTPKPVVQKSPFEEVQKQEDSEEIQEKPLAASITPVVQLAPVEEETVQEKKDVTKPKGHPVQKMPFEDIQPKEDQEEIQEKPETSTLSSVVQRASDEEETVQQKDNGNGSSNSNLEGTLNSTKGGGESMDKNTKATMESGFGNDFSQVRIHTNTTAVQMNKELGAQAFAHGNDVYFNKGKYNPGTKDGQHLLAHELTHTIQQTGKGQLKVQANLSPDLVQLNDMLDSWNVPEEDVITKCGALSPTDKAVVLAGGYRSRMAASLNVSEMIRAVNNLGAVLSTKLEWVNDSAFTTNSISYSEIKGMVTSAPNQAERDVLATSYWRGIFVSICDNDTIIEAVDDLQFDLVTKITWLEAEVFISQQEIDYSMIEPWVTHANTNQTQKDVLKTDRWKNFFVTICTNTTMVTALDDLTFDLVTTLTWLEAEVFITSWELNYSDVQHWILLASSTQPQKDLLKTDRWKAFFVSICTETTIFDAVDELSFDLATQLVWINAEGPPLTAKLTWLLDQTTDYDIIRPEIVSASTSDRQAALDDTTLRALINSTLTAPHSVAVFSHLLLGSMWWRNPQGNDFYAYFVTNSGTGTLPNSATMNCWESITYAAYLANKINAAWIKTFYNTAFAGGGDPNILIWSQLGWTSGLPAYPATRPTVGQLVFYTTPGDSYPGHIAMAIDGDFAISLWTRPNNDWFIQRIRITDLTGDIQIGDPPW